MYDLVRSYGAFQEQRRPPAIRPRELFEAAGIESVPIRFVACPPLVSLKYLMKLNDIKKITAREVVAFESDVDKFEREPPPFEMPADRDLLPRISAGDSLNSTILVQQMMLQLEEITAADCKVVTDLLSALRSLGRRVPFDGALKKVATLEELDSQIQELRDRSRLRVLGRDLLVSLRSLCSFQVRSIQQRNSTISLPFPAPPITTNSGIEAHVRAADQFRQKRLRDEVDEISKYLCHVKMNQLTLIMTFSGPRQNVRFQVAFRISGAYPWAKTQVETMVQLGDAKRITQGVAAICKRSHIGNKPILEICKAIVSEFDLMTG
jgi:hypothetical protein